ncbi:MAG: DNA recombination protein RmuC, partial [Patescibacteria group bacterium]|nr:DNA recombination protein RmuC [Patescibacteria group bacterium]
MNILLIVLIIVFIGGFIGLVVFLNKRFGAGKGDQSFLLIQNQINELNKTIDNKLGQSNQILQQQFSQSAQIIREVTEHLTKLDETNKQVINFTEQLQSLQDILKNPKQRGILGEYYLETLLKNILPPDTYKMQYKFLDGEIVDAVVFVGNKIIPVDSKFSLENYNRIIEEKNQAEKDKLEKQFVSDLKQRVTETAKYIRPNENTMDFAFMFIPHEAIYYDLLINKIGSITGDTESIIQRAAGKYHVIIVSPTSFLAYLQTVLQGLKALKIEESIKEIIKNVGDVGKHLLSYEEYMKKLGNNLGTTVGMYNSAYKEFKKIDKDITKIAG